MLNKSVKSTLLTHFIPCSDDDGKADDNDDDSKEADKADDNDDSKQDDDESSETTEEPIKKRDVSANQEVTTKTYPIDELLLVRFKSFILLKAKSFSTFD